MKALERENGYLKEAMKMIRQKFKDLKSEFKAYKLKKRAQRRILLDESS